MENKFMTALKNENNLTYTENHARTYKSTLNGLLDLFGMGGAYRSRSDADCILLFKKAFEEDETLALKCLFYLRDVRGGQGERRFFRVVMHWLANTHPETARRNLQHIPLYGRWDDLYLFVGTPLENDALSFIRHQLALDVECKTPSLLAKWLPSENTSSAKTRTLATKVRHYLNMTSKQYRKTLSILRARINVLERLMSAGEWDKIEFDKISSRAGLIYRNAFARHDVERMKNAKEPVISYEEFAKDKDSKVNAKALYPYEVVAKAYNLTRGNSGWWGYHEHQVPLDSTEREVINKYWDNLQNVFEGYSFNGLCMCDTSGSMWGTEASAPINVAIAISLYCAEHSSGPFAGHYISFSSRPQLIETDGVDFVDKVQRIYRTNLCENTNIEAAFDMLLKTAIQHHCSQQDIPANIIVCSDMEFDAGRGYYERNNTRTLMENIERKWNAAGYKMPNLIYWNIQARQNNIAMTVKDGVSFVSGMSPTIFTQIMTGKTALDLVYETLDSERYKVIS